MSRPLIGAIVAAQGLYAQTKLSAPGSKMKFSPGRSPDEQKGNSGQQ